MDQKKLFELSDNSSYTTWSYAEFAVWEFGCAYFYACYHTFDAKSTQLHFLGFTSVFCRCPLYCTAQ